MVDVSPKQIGSIKERRDFSNSKVMKWNEVLNLTHLLEFTEVGNTYTEYDP